MRRGPFAGLQHLRDVEIENTACRGGEGNGCWPVEEATGRQGIVKVSRLDPLGEQEGQLEGGVVSDQRPGPKRLKDGPGDAAHIEDGRAPPAAIELAEPDAGALRIEAGPQRVLDRFR